MKLLEYIQPTFDTCFPRIGEGEARSDMWARFNGIQNDAGNLHSERAFLSVYVIHFAILAILSFLLHIAPRCVESNVRICWVAFRDITKSRMHGATNPLRRRGICQLKQYRNLEMGSMLVFARSDDKRKDYCKLSSASVGSWLPNLKYINSR